MRAVAMLHPEGDPRSTLMDAVAPYLDGIEPLGSQVLVGIYVRPTQTASGIHLPDKYRDEDVYQGKVGLVLKAGPLAFQDDEHHKFSSFPRLPATGDWVVYRIGDTFPFVIGETNYRFVEDVAIRAIVDRPDIIL